MSGMKSLDGTAGSLPTVTVRTIGGEVQWGPTQVEPTMTVRDLATMLDKPFNSPGLKLVHKQTILQANSTLASLADPIDLQVQFDPPKVFDHSFVEAFIELAERSEGECYFDGDVVKPSGMIIPNAEVLKATMRMVLGSAEWLVRVRVLTDSPILVSRTGDGPRQRVELRIEDVVIGGRKRRVKQETACGTLLDRSAASFVTEIELTDPDPDYDGKLEVIDGPLHALVRKHASEIVHEGVSFETARVPKEMTDRLSALIDRLKASTKPDYHPGSNNVVRDIVHPSLFPYVEGISEFTDRRTYLLYRTRQEEFDVGDKIDPEKDLWGRKYERSKYQWLPAEVSVSADGACKFESYINNLDRDANSELYSALEELLCRCLPHLESVWSHGSAVDAPESDEDGGSCDDCSELEDKSLRSRSIQVITKIVDYEVPPGGMHEGVWHVEGMSHENIVATAELILAKGSTLKGGDLEFKRTFTGHEAGELIREMPQGRPDALDHFVREGLVPLGQLSLPCGRLAAWPNSHIHRVTPLVNTSAVSPATRRIVVFWLINPEVRILSTKHIKPQQGTMSWDDALRHRLALMEERKRLKGNWNLREVSLCEH